MDDGAVTGTVAAVARGDYLEDAAGTPVELELTASEVFEGDLSDTVTVHTWGFAEPGSEDVIDPTGVRIFAD